MIKLVLLVNHTKSTWKRRVLIVLTFIPFSLYQLAMIQLSTFRGAAECWRKR